MHAQFSSALLLPHGRLWAHHDFDAQEYHKPSDSQRVRSVTAARKSGTRSASVARGAQL